jgi:ComF family protein
LPTLSPIEGFSSCPRCAAPFDGGADRGCPDCRRLPRRLAKIHAPYEYGGALKSALLRLKWQGRDDLAGPLGRLLAPALSSCVGEPVGFDLLVPVPLHPRRLRQRGFNQATLLARAAVDEAGLRKRLPLVPLALQRVRSDPPARGVGPQARFARTLGAFTVQRKKAAQLAGRRVLLLDDVVTTGATAAACASALAAAGASHVEALALVRASTP